MKVISDVTGICYENEDAVFYRNLVQAAWLLNKPNGTLNLLDIFCDGRGKMVLVFDKDFHKLHIQEWAERSREYKDNKDN